ncbi:MAG: flagellar hook-basal body complex protein, partial [Lachnospiraceae bacterium]|nr:flagellar hook-basal body complex protein [Lachnospiraceae bacterium]
MVKGLYTAYTGMINEQHRMDTLTNNLANSTTVGFKKEGSTSQSFNAVLALKVKDTSEPANIPKRIGYNNPGVKIGENYTDWAQGSFKITDNTYDLALSGDGFFEIEFTNKAGETSTKYSRDGSFTLTQEGYLVTKDGNYVMGSRGRIQLNPL